MYFSRGLTCFVTELKIVSMGKSKNDEFRKEELSKSVVQFTKSMHQQTLKVADFR